jgi:hypothetical protein
MKDVVIALDQALVEMHPIADEVPRLKAEGERPAQQFRCVNELKKRNSDSKPVRWDRQSFAHPVNI